MDEHADPGRRAEPTRFATFDTLLATYRRTWDALLSVLGDRSGTGDPRDVIAEDGLRHVDAIRAGLMALARTGQFRPDELEALVRRAGIGDGTPRSGPEAIAAAVEALHVRPPIRTADPGAILAAGHARVVFSAIPRLSGARGWPLPDGSYADIPTPRSEAELIERVDEIARVLWRIAERRQRRDEPLRRVIAFYETGARLSLRGGFAA